MFAKGMAAHVTYVVKVRTARRSSSSPNWLGARLVCARTGHEVIASRTSRFIVGESGKLWSMERQQRWGGLPPRPFLDQDSETRILDLASCLKHRACALKEETASTSRSQSPKQLPCENYGSGVLAWAANGCPLVFTGTGGYG